MDRSAAYRAEWLARLVEAVEGAQQLAWELRIDESASADARELYGRLEAVRVELQSLQGVASDGCAAIEPDLLGSLGWGRGILGSSD